MSSPFSSGVPFIKGILHSMQRSGSLSLASPAHCGAANGVRSCAGFRVNHPHEMLLTEDITLDSLLDVEPKHVEQIHTLQST